MLGFTIYCESCWPPYLLDVKIQPIVYNVIFNERPRNAATFSPLHYLSSIMSQKVDAPQFKMPHSVVWIVLLPKHFLFTTNYRIQQDMGVTLDVLQKQILVFFCFVYPPVNGLLFSSLINEHWMFFSFLTTIKKPFFLLKLILWNFPCL